MNTRIVPILFGALVVSAFLPAPAEAQVLYGSLVGTIADPSDAVIPGAKVTITNKATGLAREVTTDASGRYAILNVVPGWYELKAAAPGFRPVARTDMEVTINTVTRADLKLEVGQLAEQVTITASAVLLQTDKSDIRHEITGKTIQNLPLPAYRNYQSLIAMVTRSISGPWVTRSRSAT